MRACFQTRSAGHGASSERASLRTFSCPPVLGGLDFPCVNFINQRAANGGVRSVVVEFGIFGAPRFSIQRSQNPLKVGIWGPLDGKRGTPKTPNSTTTDLTPHLRPSESSKDSPRSNWCFPDLFSKGLLTNRWPGDSQHESGRFANHSRESIRRKKNLSGLEKGVITKGVFSLEKSLQPLKSLNSLESLENGRILLYFSESEDSLKCLDLE